jgi:hypothetical protein
MIDLRFSRYTLVVCAAIAALAGCGGRADDGVEPVSDTPNSVSGSQTFTFTGTEQIFQVPR